MKWHTKHTSALSISLILQVPHQQLVSTIRRKFRITGVTVIDDTHGSSRMTSLRYRLAFILDGDYPPAGKNLNDCPRSGSFGPCTKAALSAFQTKYQISGEKDEVGSTTL